MNKKLLGLFFLVALTVSFFLIYEREKPNLPSPKFVEVTEEETFTKPQKILDLANGRPSKDPKTKKIDNKDHPCLELISLFADSSLSDIRERPEDILDLRKGNCNNEINKALGKTFLGPMREVCLKSPKDLNSRDCDIFLTYFRAWAISMSFPDDDLSSLDETILINKFIWKFASNNDFKLEGLDQSLKMANEIISRRPDFFGAYKAKLIPLFLKEIKHKQNMEDDITSTLDVLNSLGTNEEVDEFPIVRELNSENIDENKVKDYIDTFIQKHPNSSRGQYYLAALKWKKTKDRAATKKILEKALKLNPKDEFVRESLRSMNNSKEGKPLFYFSMNFDFQNI
jgi:tetratricopeptide (TPR) repeat protein